jgi:hypothetical protein
MAKGSLPEHAEKQSLMHAYMYKRGSTAAPGGEGDHNHHPCATFGYCMNWLARCGGVT